VFIDGEFFAIERGDAPGGKTGNAHQHHRQHGDGDAQTPRGAAEGVIERGAHDGHGLTGYAMGTRAAHLINAFGEEMIVRIIGRSRGGFDDGGESGGDGGGLIQIHRGRFLENEPDFRSLRSQPNGSLGIDENRFGNADAIQPGSVGAFEIAGAKYGPAFDDRTFDFEVMQRDGAGFRALKDEIVIRGAPDTSDVGRNQTADADRRLG